MLKKTISIGPLLGYCFVASIPFSLMTFEGQRLSYGGVMLHEMVLIVIILYSILMFALKAKSIDIILLDWITLMYVFFALIPVVLNIENLYLVARDYRHLFLVPLIAYFFFPFLFSDVQQITHAFLFFIPGLLIGNIPFLPEFLKTGIRQRNINTITIGLLSSWSAILAFIVGQRGVSGRFKFIIYPAVLLMLLLMVFSVSRGVILAFMVTLFLSFVIFKKKTYQKIFICSSVAFIMMFYLSLTFVNKESLKTSSILSEEYREMRRSIYRLTTVDYYIDDFKNRMYLWKEAYNFGMEKPILGRGAYWYRNIGPSTPHNIFVAVFLTSGFLGMVLFLILITVTYSTIFSLAKDEKFMGWSKFLFIAFTILLIVGSTNDFSGGRYLLFFILLAAIATTKKIQRSNEFVISLCERL
jgi:O-antigen ligase